MLSICIPIYNYDITQLVGDLSEQAEKLSIPYEFLLIDDASSNEFRVINRQINVPNLRYIQLEQNIGRSKIRNLLAQESRYQYLIFMDCDSAVASEHYIANYLPYCQSDMVCYGGRCYEKKTPSKSCYLRWKYGVERESDTAEKRRKNPNYGFCTNNFLIDKAVLEKVHFNEDLSGYGHEDTLFGLELFLSGIMIQHIDNPLIHIGLEASDVFIEKTENGLFNLSKIEALIQGKSTLFEDYSKLIRTKRKLSRWHLQKPVACLFKMLKKPIKRNLLSRHASLFLFDFYKLGYFCTL